jgi:hypothetical protein
MLSRLAQTSNAKVFLLIDALDECDPQDRLGDLADMILWLSRLSNVKLCVSCRPWAPFTRRFDKATVLHLDQLTYHDMEVYIETRLLCAENEADLCTDFHDGTLPAKRLINDVADAANGVFLWVELVVNALCSEIRTGCSVDQLHLAISEFPTDLDDYFQNLIFGRIGTTRPNVTKTAAALKLAMITHSQKVKMDEAGFDIPMSHDYLNFWLLSVGQLKPGFSWTDQSDPRYSAFDTDNKLRQTKAFLEETCKDLLVIHSYGQSYDVEFLHRTVFDFLCDNAASLHIEEHAPGHFSDEGFAMDLLKLRCICRLREHDMGCEWVWEWLKYTLASFGDTTALEIHQPWLLAVESAVLETFHNRCVCLGLRHSDETFLAKKCATLGLHRYLLETAQDMPHGAFCQHRSDGCDHLELALLEVERAGTRKATTIPLLRQALECGCDPNVTFNRHRTKYSCGQSKWEIWLHTECIYTQQHSRVVRGDRAHQSTCATKDIDCQRIRENAYIIKLFLRHGADPSCTPCTTDHQIERFCSPTALHDILQYIVPAECLSQLRARLVACSSEDRRYTLRRNQRKRAIRSYVISEQRFLFRDHRCHQELRQNEREDMTSYHWHNWRCQQELFLRSLMNPYGYHPTFETCEQFDKCYYCLLEWCLDCGSRSHACLNCNRPLSWTKHAPCPNFSNPDNTQPQRHTTVAVVFDIESMKTPPPEWEPTNRDPARLNTAYQSLGWGPGELCLTPEAALSVLKEWYARNPLEPDSSEAEFQGMVLPEELSLAE